MALGISMPISPLPPEDFTPAMRAYTGVPPDGDVTMDSDGVWVGILGKAGDIADLFLPYYRRIESDNLLGPRLTELVRLAIANTTQCEACLLERAPAAIAEGLTEEEISYITELDKGGFNPRERAAIRFALNFGGNHHSIDEEQWDELKRLFNDEEIMQLCLFCATFLGTGRLAHALRLIDASCTLPGHRLAPLAAVKAE